MSEPPADPSNIHPGPVYLGGSSVPPGPPSDGGLEAWRVRVDVIEGKVDDLNPKVAKIDDRVRQTEITLGRVEGKLDVLGQQIVGKLPSRWQLPVAVSGIVSFLALFLGVLQRLQLMPK